MGGATGCKCYRSGYPFNTIGSRIGRCPLSHAKTDLATSIGGPEGCVHTKAVTSYCSAIIPVKGIDLALHDGIRYEVGIGNHNVHRHRDIDDSIGLELPEVWIGQVSFDLF